MIVKLTVKSPKQRQHTAALDARIPQKKSAVLGEGRKNSQRLKWGDIRRNQGSRILLIQYFRYLESGQQALSQIYFLRDSGPLIGCSECSSSPLWRVEFPSLWSVGAQPSRRRTPTDRSLVCGWLSVGLHGGGGGAEDADQTAGHHGELITSP